MITQSPLDRPSTPCPNRWISASPSFPPMNDGDGVPKSCRISGLEGYEPEENVDLRVDLTV